VTTETKRTKEEYMAVANTIAKQIGGGALYMIGARNKIGFNEKMGGLMFKTMKVAKGNANFVKITLAYDDTYDVKFSYIYGMKEKVITELEGVYFDQLRSLIEKYTGLYTKL